MEFSKFLRKKHTKYYIFGILIILIILFFNKGNSDVESYDTTIAERGELIQEVSVTGRVKASERVDMAFEKTGKVSQIYVDVGQFVSKGTLLIKLENSDIFAQLNQAEANVKIEKAKLDELNRGSREEVVEVQRVKVANAEASLNEAKTNIVDTLNDSFTKSDNAIRNDIDQFFSNPNGSFPQINLTFNDTSLQNKINQERGQVEIILDSWKDLLPYITTNSDLDSHIYTVKSNLEIIKNFLNDASLAVNSATPTGTITQTTIDGYKYDVSIARTSINTAISNTSTSEEKYNNAKSSLALERQELALKEAGTAEEQIIAQVAKVEQAEASVDNYKAQLSKTLIYAPFSGIITKQEAEIGGVITAGNTVVSMISASKFEIETDVPEADIAKLKIGDSANVTLDAYGDEVFFNAIVTEIEPAETIIEGVATYKTILQFINKDERIRSGMTANIDILTNKREDVVFIPSRAIITSDGKKKVRVIKDESYIEVEVEVGLRGSDGYTEIINGISEGDEVVVFIKDK